MTELKLDYPHANTRAAKMLDVAIDQMSKNDRGSLRQIAGRLGYKSAVILSHMRSGRLAIPIDRAIDLARATEMDAGAFLLAVLEQRHPEIDFIGVLTGRDAQQDRSMQPLGAVLAANLSDALDQSVTSLSSEHIGVIREIVAEPHPRKRWVGVNESGVIQFIRHALPEVARDGLTSSQKDELKSAFRPS